MGVEDRKPQLNLIVNAETGELVQDDEIQRLRDIMEITKQRPVLFLLDEILHGTNSHDRAVGAEAVIRGLIDRGAIGLVTTHDLALARRRQRKSHLLRRRRIADPGVGAALRIGDEDEGLAAGAAGHRHLDD